MSLFKTKEWWRTECGANETFDARSLLIAPFGTSEKKDMVIVTSHQGYLRMYDVSSQWIDEAKAPTAYKSTDLLIEYRLDDCIVDVKAGRFVSASSDLRLAILTTNKLIVYTIILTKGFSEHGDRCELEVAYEHRLAKFPASLTVGPFGGVRGRDFLCVQCADGTLLFYEQETYAFSQLLRNRLLPEPIVYVSLNDVFVTTNSSWILECYRYQSIAEFGRKKESKTKAVRDDERELEAEWSYNIGEAVLGIDVVTLSSFEIGIVVLGEKNLYCLKDNCASLKYTKKLEYRGLCFQAYVIEPDGKLMVLVIADTNTLMIYEGTTLRWSAQMPFAPVAVRRAHLQYLDGAIVALSEDGRLEICYLGSEPSLFVAPPIHRRTYDHVVAEEKLLQLRKTLRKNRQSGEQLTSETADTELLMNASASPDLEICPFVDNETTECSKTERSMCRVTIEISSYTALRDVQVFIQVYKPFVATNECCLIPNLCDTHTFQTIVYPVGNSLVMSSEIKVTASYKTDDEKLRVLQRTFELPLKMVLRACPPENTSSFTVTIKCGEPLANFNQLFPEFASDHLQRQNRNVLGLQHMQTGHIVTIISSVSSNRFRVQSNDGLAIPLVMRQLVNRLKDKSTGRLIALIGQPHVQLVHTHMEAHFLCRQEIERIKNEIGLLTSQLRNIERRLLRIIRERNNRSLTTTGFQFLLDSTHDTMLALVDDLAAAQAERERTAHKLRCALTLLLLLLRLNVNDDKYAMIEAAIGFEAQLRVDMEWEEVVDVAIAVLLKATSRKQGMPDTKSIYCNKFTSMKDLTRLKKRLAHAIERLDTYRESTIEESESEANSLALS